MRIVHILTRLLRAGSEENTLIVCAGQMADGHEVYVLHGHEAAPSYAYDKVPGIKLIEIPDLTRALRPVQDARALRHMTRVLTKLAPDVVHSHQSKAGILGRFAAARAGVPRIVHGVHILPFLGETGYRRAIYLTAERAAARQTDAFIHVSDGMEAACRSNGVGRAKPHYVIRSGFDLDRFARAEPPVDWRALLGVATGSAKPPVVVMLSSLEPRKRHLDLIDRVPAILARHPDTRFVLAGEGHMREQIKARIAERELGGHVVVPGYRADPERLVALADICIHCSSREGLPRSVLQYVAVGRPTVMFHLPGIEDVLVSGVNGRIVGADDWPAFVTALGDLLDNAAARTVLAAGARATDMSRWDATTMAVATLRVYESIATPRIA